MSLLLWFTIAASAADLESGDGYIRGQGDRWSIGTAAVEKVIRVAAGHVALVSFRNKRSGHEYVEGRVGSAEVRLRVNGQELSGSDEGWNLVRAEPHRLKQDELQLDLVLRHAPLEITKHYVAYPGTAVVREWLTISNVSPAPVRIGDPAFLETRIFSAESGSLDLYYMTGGGAYNGSQLLKEEKLSPAYARTFDSYGPSDTGPRGMSYSAHLPLLVVHDAQTGDGVATGWDYMGHWRYQAGNFNGAPVNLSLRVAGYENMLASGASIETPKAFTAAFTGDLDEMGNRLLDWQYQYLWDLTNPDYFAKTRWAVDWPPPWVGKGGVPSADNWGRRLALDLRYVDLLRKTGGDILWDDAGWYDAWGSWNGPDWRLTNAYVAKNGMRWALWFPTFLAIPESAVGQQHPDWLLPKRDAFEQSIAATADWQEQVLAGSAAAWGDFQWRYDIAPAVSATDTGYLAADRNFRGLVRWFKETHARSAVDACFGGGRWISYGLARLAESGEYTDGGVGPYSNYYTSLLVPPDKLHNVVDFDHTYYNAASDRIHLAMDPTWYRDPGDGPDVEAIRRDWELYHYLLAQGVAGRWSHVFRPPVEGDDPVWYFQRMNRDGDRGVIITKHCKLGATYYLVSKPKQNSSADAYFGRAGDMSRVSTSGAARADTGIYEDPVDGQYRYYGVPGEIYGPLNFGYESSGGTASYVRSVLKLGGKQPVKSGFFGMAFEAGAQPITITRLGQYDGTNNQGTYTLRLVRAADGVVLGSADLDMAQGNVDALGFKYARLSQPVRLDAAPVKPVIIRPRGLKPEAVYDVRCAKSAFRAIRTGRELMDRGIEIGTVAPGELIFLNVPNYPGSGQDKTPPRPPAEVTKRRASNLGVQGIELSWSPGNDDNWVSFYEVLKDGVILDKVARGTFYFDHGNDARHQLRSVYQVRTVDGDGNRSAPVAAGEARGEPLTFRALGDFGPTQGANQWRYEQSITPGQFGEMVWDSGGYEGRWTGSGLARIGRIWMEPATGVEVSRTFVAPVAGRLTLYGSIQRDPSSKAGRRLRARILHQDRQLWPSSGWAEIPPAYPQKLAYRLENIAVAKGDAVRFVLARVDAGVAEVVIWDPAVVIQ